MNAPFASGRFNETVDAHFGLYGGTVTDNKDPESRGRVKVRLPWIADDFVTEWAVVAQIYAGDGFGAYWIPELEDQVILAFLGGRLERPIIVGALYSEGEAPHAARSGSADPKYFRTKAGHMLLMEDGSGRKIELVDSTGNNSVLIDSEANSITVKAQGDVNVKGGANVTVEATGNLTLKGAAIKIEATGTVTVSGTAINLN
jgi:phage baseplate assembly protein V